MSDIKVKRCLTCDCKPSVELDEITTVCCINDSCIMSNLEECEVKEWNTRNTSNKDLIEENAQLKADKAELVDMLNFLGDTSDMRSDIYAAVKELVQKHKEPNNGN